MNKTLKERKSKKKRAKREEQVRYRRELQNIRKYLSCIRRFILGKREVEASIPDKKKREKKILRWEGTGM